MGSAAGAAVGLTPGTSKTHGGIRAGEAGLGPRCPPGKEAVLEPGRGGSCGSEEWSRAGCIPSLHAETATRDGVFGQGQRQGHSAEPGAGMAGRATPWEEGGRLRARRRHADPASAADRSSWARQPAP